MTEALAQRTVNGVEVPVSGAWQVDPSHTTVEFIVRHLMFAKVRGRFGQFTGSVTIADDPARSSAEATIQAASIDTGEEQRDGHLRSPDFFDAERFPTLTFRTTGIEHAGGSAWRVTGDFTIRGVTRPIVLDTTLQGLAIDPWGNSRAFLSAAAEINREEFGLTWNQPLQNGGVVVGKQVKLEIEAQIVKQG
ncbi:MAG: polyisoprenoid-binding protein [Nitriliruptorales bacterium]|nr:polyisoprenoid-binding protein [Nitriliruptorales bacterium]